MKTKIFEENSIAAIEKNLHDFLQPYDDYKRDVKYLSFSSTPKYKSNFFGLLIFYRVVYSVLIIYDEIKN